MLTLQLISLVVPFALGMGFLIWAQHKGARQILDRWATATGVTIISAEKRYLRTGPFGMGYTRGQFIFRFIATDPAGVTRAGWLRVGGSLSGVLSNQTKVIWNT